jgi:hypothetical protein
MYRSNTMQQFHNIFEYLPTQRIAVCKSHQQGIIKSQLQTHLDNKHQELVARTRRDIVGAVHQEASLQQWAMTEEEVVFPNPISMPLPHLLSLMGERIRVGLGANPSRNPKYSEANPYH